MFTLEYFFDKKYKKSLFWKLLINTWQFWFFLYDFKF